MLENLYKKVISGSTLNLEDVLKYIELVAKAINPSTQYNPNYSVAMIQNGMGDILIGAATSAIESNPNKVGFQVTKVYNSQRILIKTITKKLN